MERTNSLSDAEIIAGCIKHDNIARKNLYSKYSTMLYTTAYYVVKDYELSNDILHDAFIQIFNDIGSLKKVSALSAWMKKIVVHTSLKLLKRNRRIEYCDEPVKLDTIIWPDPMSGEMLQKALLNLPDGYRVVFTLIEIEGYKHSEVANMLNISEGTSKSQLHHAKKYLKKMLSNKFQYERN